MFRRSKFYFVLEEDYCGLRSGDKVEVGAPENLDIKDILLVVGPDNQKKLRSVKEVGRRHYVIGKIIKRLIPY